MSKEEIIAELLKNTVYQPDSGVVVNLRKALMKLSEADLNNLSLITNLRITAAIRESKKGRGELQRLATINRL